MNQFVHSLYPRPLPVLDLLERLALPGFIALTCLMATFLISKDATSKHLGFASLSGSGPVSHDGLCVS